MHQMRWLSLALVVTCATGCGGSDDDDTAVDAAPDTDTAGAATLRIAWTTDKAVPGDIGSNNRLDDVKLRMEGFEAVVIVSPNDPRTTRDEVNLHWDNDSGPDEVVFTNAPTGLYTSVLLKLDSAGFTHAVSIAGHFDVSNTNQSFEVESDDALSISMATDFTLTAGTDKTMTIQIGIADAVNQLDYMMDSDVTDSDTAAMGTFRSALQVGFSAVAPVKETTGL